MREYSTNIVIRTLQLVEDIARHLGILPPLPEDPPPMPTVTKSIGTTGRDYSTITAWEADLDLSGIYSSGDDAVGECYADSDFLLDEGLALNGGGTIGLTSRKLTVEANERHDGTSGTGVAVVFSTTSGWTTDNSVTSETIVEWLELDGAGQNITQLFSSAGVSSNTNYIKHLIVHDTAGAGSSRVGIVIGANRGGHIFNCIVYDITQNVSGSQSCEGISLGVGNKVQQCLNCTIHNTVNDAGSGNCYGLQADDEANGTFRNNLITGTAGTTSGTIQDIDNATYSNATVSHNATSDTSSSGTGSLDSVTTADQYVSITGGSEDLHLKNGADAINAGTDLGTTPSGVEIDIDGWNRDSDTPSRDPWDMGAHEFEAAAAAIVAAALIVNQAIQTAANF